MVTVRWSMIFRSFRSIWTSSFAASMYPRRIVRSRASHTPQVFSVHRSSQRPIHSLPW